MAALGVHQSLDPGSHYLTTFAKRVNNSDGIRLEPRAVPTSLRIRLRTEPLAGRTTRPSRRLWIARAREISATRINNRNFDIADLIRDTALTAITPESPTLTEARKLNEEQVDISMQNRVFVLKRKAEFAYETRPTPDLPTSKHVLIKVLATGICGSDVHYWQHGEIGPFVVRDPLVLGYESAGVVVRCGSNVKNIKQGDRVAIEPGVPCRSCEFCRGGKYNLCKEMQFAATPPWMVHSLPTAPCLKTLLPDFRVHFD
ncbi:hypothetical protein VTL71DRAFT_3808 [Oculimacula yallundae]|uniref:Alcohol dehydrogenase-like N-terminal domain-containing protein n=1 Tax=Oculimacula yallundae TaxID=86028 RepID=A0ABR4C436_9HELO